MRLINARPDLAREGKHASTSSPSRSTTRRTFTLLGSGETKGVFQLESSGMQQLFKDLKADCFEDIVAAVALYRPGPLGSGMVRGLRQPQARPRSRSRRCTRSSTSSSTPTYGVIVYQEQVMQIAQTLAGYTLGGADLLRRAMGKKKPEEMAKQKSTFVDGAMKNGVTQEDAERIFGLLEYFAGYGFNKSHSAAYALITYQTAYLKAHYPVELLCAIMTSDKDKIEKVVRTIADARAMGIDRAPAGHQRERHRLQGRLHAPRRATGSRVARGERRRRTRCGPQIRFGLGAVRGVGGAALEAVFEARDAAGPFARSLRLRRARRREEVNKGVFEALVQCGAFDATLAERGVVARAGVRVDRHRARALARGEPRPRGGADEPLRPLRRRPRPTSAPRSARASRRATTPSASRGTGARLLVRERQSLGFYVSGHPLERYVKGRGAALASSSATPLRRVRGDGRLGGREARRDGRGLPREIFKDGGGKVAFFELEDLTGRVNVKVRGRADRDVRRTC